MTFTFEGARVDGFLGDTIASALIANGVWMHARSFKYHRPRGPLALAGRDANALVQVDEEPNVPADAYPIREGLAVKAQHYRGSLQHDRLAVPGWLARLLPVGFYYRAFYRPYGAWQHVWEPLFRARAGLGRVVIHERHPEPLDKEHRFCDVAVIGAGPAGMAAAIAAAEAGAEVLLVDEQPAPGGSLGYVRADADGTGAKARLDAVAQTLASQPRIEVLTATTCTGIYADNWLALVRDGMLLKLRAREVVLAVGCLEQPLVFRNNDLPGIVLGTAAQRLIRLYGVRPGTRAVVLTGDDAGYGVALDLADAGVDVTMVGDLRAQLPGGGPLRAEAMRRGLSARAVTRVDEARPGADGARVGAIVLDDASYPCDLYA